MSRYELRALAEAVVVTRGAVGWDRPLQTFFAQLFSIDDEGEEHAHVWIGTYPHVWIGTYPHELDSAVAAIAIVAGDCVVPGGLAKTLETDRLASLGTFDGPGQVELKSVLVKPAAPRRS